MTTTHIAQVALEWWRASGKRTPERLRDLVDGVSTTNGERDYADYHYQSALAATRAWEIEAA